jgi:hypothetical protein
MSTWIKSATFLLRVGIFLIMGSVNIAFAQVLGTSFTYQGELQLNGQLVNDQCDLKFRLYDAETNGNQIGPEVTVSGVTVDAGRFTAVLDFANGAFNGDRRWLEIEVQCPSDGAFTSIGPRQEITAVPYALQTKGIFVDHATGNVGIGTTIPFDPLEVSTTGTRAISGYAESQTGTTSGVYGVSRSTTGRAISGFASNPAGFNAGVFGQSSSVDGRGVWGFNNSVTGDTVGVQGAVSSPDGYAGYFLGGRNYFEGAVGIGTDDPISMLQVGEQGQDGVELLVGVHPHLAFRKNTAEGKFRIHIAGTGFFGKVLQIGRDDQAHKIAMMGNVGIGGATNPLFKLQVINGTDTEHDSGGYCVLGTVASTNLSLDDNEIQARNNSQGSTLHLNRNDGDVLLCGLENGRVGVGITDIADIPSDALLAVDGKVLCEEVEVQLSQNWPDYVFAEDYDLMPLEKLEESIKAEKHLPGVPPAKEVEENGVAVGQMQVTLLEKVEELTLYVIDVNKQLQAVKNENALLRSQLASLELKLDKEVGQ